MDRPRPRTARERPLSGSGPSRAVVRLGWPLLLAAAVTLAAFLLLTLGLQRLTATEAADFTGRTADDELYLPRFLHDPPETVKTTADYGPPGPVSVVFAGDVVVSGLVGELAHPWIAVSGLTGDYRALVAPHLPPAEAGAVAVSADGRSLAWGYADGVVVYDAVHDSSRELPLDVDADVQVGEFSPDGRLLTAYGDGVLRVVEVASGEVLGELPLDDRAAGQAVWTPDGAGLTYVARGRLVTRPWQGGPAVHAPIGVADGAVLDWHPSGERVAATQTRTTGSRVLLFDVRDDGGLEPAGTLSRDSYSQQRMLGFSSGTTVSAIGLGLGTGPLPQLYRMSTESPIATGVAQLPPEDRVVATLEVADEPLQNGSSSFAEPDWPISDLAKLVLSIVAGVFVAGLALTRSPRTRRRGPGD